MVLAGASSIARYLASLDSTYAASFAGDAWRDMMEARADAVEAATRVTRYLHNASATVMLPIAEAMLTYKEKRLVFLLVSCHLGSCGGVCHFSVISDIAKR